MAAGLSALSLAIYLHAAFLTGWYYDDWALYAQQRNASGGFFHHLHVCSAGIQGGRTLACLYHVTEYAILGGHRSLYHLVIIGFVIAIAVMAYLLLCRCGLPWQGAALVSAMMIVCPASDSTRLWPVAAIGQFIIAVQLAGMLIAISALRRPPGRRTLALHITAGALSLLAMATYEIAIPLVLLNGIAYWAAVRNRSALWRGAVDVGLVGAFLFYRTVISPVDSASGLVVHRNLSATLSRADVLLTGTWNSWHSLFIPGAVGIVLSLAVLVGAGVTAALDTRSRRALLPWAALLLASAVTAFACSLVFLTANDYYVPATFGTFNRLNLPAMLAFAAGFVALAGLGYEVIRRLVPAPSAVAAAIVALGVLASGYHQWQVSWDHKHAWEVSWLEQRTALAGIRPTVAALPGNSRILGFDTPVFETGFVPVFAATWDLRGAISYTTRLRPPVAVPDEQTVSCEPDGLFLDGAFLTSYSLPREPLYAVSPRRRAAVLIASQRDCEQITARWGHNPLWGRTVTG